MRLRTVVSLCVAVAIATSVSADEKQFTGSKPNGAYWLALEPAARKVMLNGIFTGLAMAGSYGDLSTETQLKLIRTGKSFDELVKTFDAFYAAPGNARIPIESLWMAEVARASGVADAEIAKMMKDLRAAVSGEAPQPTAPLPTKYPEVYDVALNHADRSKTLDEVLGEEWETSNERANAWALGPDQGEAYVFFDITGPKGTGRINGHAKRIGGRWVYDDLRVLVIGTGDIVDLLRDTKE